MAEQAAIEKPNAGGNKKLPPDAEKPPGDIRRRVAKKLRQGPFVKYVGHAAERTIRSQEWATLNIELKDPKATHKWSIANNKMIEADQFSPEQLDYLLIDDTQKHTNVHNFLAVDYDEDQKIVQIGADKL